MNVPAARITGIVGHVRETIRHHTEMRVILPPAFPKPKAGQFVMATVPGDGSRLLGRPLSVYGWDDAENEPAISLYFRVVGEGTRLLSCLEAGAALDLLGPLGRPFDVPEACDHAILVAGGMGVVPLTALARQIRRERTDIRLTAFLGARSADLLPGREALERVCDVLYVCTDDGTCGVCGTVTELFAPGGIPGCLRGRGEESAIFYACGPQAMLRALAALVKDRPIRGQVSLEERMACGIGACLGCAVPVHDGEGGIAYRRVCKDGPVFECREIAWT